MALSAFVLSILLMGPFLAWGIYTLRLRYLLHEELPPKIEIATLCGVILFLSLQLLLIRAWIGAVGIFYAFAMLSLAAASTSLYGPIFVSVASKFVVDLLHPPHEHDAHEPHYGPAEALEGELDYEGALREYMVIARVFPKDDETAFRVAHILCETDRYEEAAESFERGLALCDDPERSALAATRLSDIYRLHLDEPEHAAECLEALLEKFPEAHSATTIQRKHDRLTAGAASNGPSAPNDPPLETPRVLEDPWE